MTKQTWNSLIEQTAHSLSTREELMRSCRELLAIVKTTSFTQRNDLAAKMIVDRAQVAIHNAAKEKGLEYDFGHLIGG